MFQLEVALPFKWNSRRFTDREAFNYLADSQVTATAFQRLAWGLNQISECTGLSVAFFRAEVRAGRLPVRRFGRRVLVRDEDLKDYLAHGSQREATRQLCRLKP